MRIRVRPKSGTIVRHPFPPYRPLSEKGEFVPRNQYWGRRLKDGDVILMAKPTGQRPTGGVKKNEKGKDKR
jgi:hypothetical protein